MLLVNVMFTKALHSSSNSSSNHNNHNNTHCPSCEKRARSTNTDRSSSRLYCFASSTHLDSTQATAIFLHEDVPQVSSHESELPREGGPVEGDQEGDLRDHGDERNGAERASRGAAVRLGRVFSVEGRRRCRIGLRQWPSYRNIPLCRQSCNMMSYVGACTKLIYSGFPNGYCYNIGNCMSLIIVRDRIMWNLVVSGNEKFLNTHLVWQPRVRHGLYYTDLISYTALLRPRKINTWFPISCLEKIGSVGREIFFFSLNVLCSSK